MNRNIKKRSGVTFYWMATLLSLSLLTLNLAGCQGSNSGTPDIVPDIAPVADAGIDQHIKTSSLVTLDGSASSGADPDDQLTYSWIMTAIPTGSVVTLARADTSHPTFAPDLDGDYVIELTVIDGVGDSAADTVTITATSAHVNATPVANAGPDQHDKPGSIILLDGSASSDADHDPLTYHWSIESMPVGADPSDILFNDTADPVKPTFILFGSVYGDYIFKLIVNDATAVSAPDTVTITITSRDVANATPVANAGLPQNVKTGTLVTLSGSKSADADGDPLTYSWTLRHKPSGSSASLSDADIVNPTFTADLAGAYLFSLVVNDGKVDSAVHSVVIFAETHLLIGLGSHGGKDSVGTIQGIAIAGGTSQPLFSFPGAPTAGVVSTSGLTRNTANGLLYGLLGGGGSYSAGAIFSYDPATGNIVTLYSFSDKDGTDPLNAPAISSNGVLYGTTNRGGQNDFGTLFSYTIADDSFKTLKHFTRDVTGHTSLSTPLVASSGTVYGTLSGGTGDAKGGTFWSYTPSSDPTIIGPFDILGRGTGPGEFSDLYLPGGPLVEHGGRIHFTARGDGLIQGAHFYWDLNTRQLQPASIFQGGKTSFCTQPSGVAVSNNSLFLYCQSNDGIEPNKPVILKVENIAPDGSTDLIVLHHFSFEFQGTFTHLIDAGVGHLYASFASETPKIYRVSETTGSAGVVFTYPIDVLGTHSMKLIAAHEGKIYGISRDRGTYREGQVYTYDTSTSVLNTTSLGYPNGTTPGSGMVKHSNGKLYGFAHKSRFEFNPDTHATRFARLSFSYNVGMRPVEGADGTLYAISTEYNDFSKLIKVVSVNPTNLDFNDLKVIETTLESPDFTSRPIIVNGKLYGLSAGGIGKDRIFVYDIAGNSSATVCAFPDGEEPVLGVTHVNGKLYGTTATGGDSGMGSVYACDIATKTITVSYSFSGTDGRTPSSVLLLAKNGLLYGTTSAGGDLGKGTLFAVELNAGPPTLLLQRLHSFSDVEIPGEGPSGVLTEASDGKIYGAAYTDGTDSEVDGVVFAFDPKVIGTVTVVQRVNKDNSAEFGFGTRYPELTEVILRGGL